MANLCLPREIRDKLLNALKKGDVSIAKLYELGSEGRHTIFKQYVGEDFAKFVNAEFERAMVSNQKKALANWIEKVSTFKEPIRRDLLKKVEKIKDVLTPDEELGFLGDLAESKLGIGVTEEEAQTILNLKKEIDTLKVEWNPEKALNESGKSAGWVSEETRLAYGYALDDFKTFVGKLKLEADSLAQIDPGDSIFTSLMKYAKTYAKPRNW